jgi:hypothetical protein
MFKFPKRIFTYNPKDKKLATIIGVTTKAAFPNVNVNPASNKPSNKLSIATLLEECIGNFFGCLVMRK